MKFLIVLNSNLKRITKSKKILIPNFLVPAIIILTLGFVFNRITGTDNEYAIINSDKGVYGEEFIKEIQKNSKVKIYKKDEGIERVKKKRMSLCYEIPEGFSELISKGEKPQIISHKIEEGAESGNFQFSANSLINKMILRSELKNNGKDISLEALNYEKNNINVIGKDKKVMGDIITLNMIISFVLFSSIGISMELFELKRQNILKRSFTTSNKPRTIIGGVLAALFLISSLGYSGIFLLNLFINSNSYLNKAPIIILNIVFLVLLALSLGVFITRIIKNENLISIVLQIIISFTCFVGGSFMPIDLLPKGIRVFSKFTPQYWALQSIDTGNVWLSFIVVLFALALFTAGTFKTKNFID